MLDLPGAAFCHCDRWGRREFLRVGGLAVGGLTLAGALRRAAAVERASVGNGTAVIQIFLGGGPSHLDMFDLKPRAPAEIRGEFNEIASSVPGTRISEHLPLLSRVMHLVSVVRSVTHSNPSHLPSSHWLQTGYDVKDPVAGRNTYPSTGSVTARVRGANAPGMPAYVAVPRGQAFAQAGYLGPSCSPFTTQLEPNDPHFHVPNLTLPADTTPDRVWRRRDLLRGLDRLRRDLDTRGELASIDQFNRDAIEMIASPRTAAAFDIGSEPSPVRERYGRTSLGQNCLLARRLVEAGATYVSCLSGGGWDTHANNFGELKRVTLPRLDQALSALVTDLHQRGLDQHVLVNVMGEFGRTPQINKDAGRDHWPGAMFVLFAGGGLRMGQMIGTTDQHAAYPTSSPYAPVDVLATIYHVLGIDYHQTFYDASRRPIPILPGGQPIEELRS